MSEKENQEPDVSTEPDSEVESEVVDEKSAEVATDTEEAIAEPNEAISDLMASGDAPAAGGGETAAAKRPDLDADAMRAAQAAIAEGERALAAARAQLSSEGSGEDDAARKRSKRRELALRLLLAANVLAMLVVMSMPSGPDTGSQPTGVGDPASQTHVAPANQPPNTGESAAKPPAGPRLADKYNQALLASESGNYAKAIELLEEYLAETPRMPASRLVNVYRAMAHYSSSIGRFREAQDYERRAQAVTQSHSLPEDLVAMAKAAAESGDQESLRQVWARFLLQQRQIPSSLYNHVAEAYLQLGDSYRVQANEAAEEARLEELRQADELIRQQGRKGNR